MWVGTDINSAFHVSCGRFKKSITYFFPPHVNKGFVEGEESIFRRSLASFTDEELRRTKLEAIEAWKKIRLRRYEEH